MQSAAAPISPAPVTAWRPEYLPAYLSNGVVGLRVGPVPFVNGICILNGFAGVDPETGVEAFAQAPYPLAGDVTIAGSSVASAPQRARLVEQRYDFSCGELHTRFLVQTDGPSAEVAVLTLCSRTHPTVVLQEVEIRVDRACDIVLRGGVDPTGVPGGRRRHSPPRPSAGATSSDGSVHWESHGELSTCGVAYATAFEGGEAEQSRADVDLRPLLTSYAFRGRKGSRYRLRTMVSLVPETLHGQPDLQAIRLLHAAQSRGWDRLRADNRGAWEELWRGRPILSGASTRWQALADAAFYYLHASAHESSLCSTSMFGLAAWPTYHYYRGHVMWDIETFAMPPLLLTAPSAARALLDYRCARLGGAIRNARLAGYSGAQYPWESAPLSGEEAAPGDGAASAHEHHVSLDVAIALVQYAHATGDDRFVRERACPVLEAIAEWAESRITETSRGFEIHRANGVAEKPEPVDNNAFVNMAASVALRGIRSAAEMFDLPCDPRWADIAARMYIPLSRRTGVIRNHDDYRTNEEKGETPEAPAGLFPLGYEVDPRIERATYAFYLDLADRYVGSPMLSALLGVHAARLGDRGRALELLERGYADFVFEPFTITDEYSADVFPEMPRAGPFTANLGGFLLSLLYGFPGLQLGAGEPSTWARRRVEMPRGWDGVEVERVFARGRPARLAAHHGADRATIEWLSEG
jgi:trehalose/maltose hydrolase-like predicted phosphorylase